MKKITLVVLSLLTAILAACSSQTPPPAVSDNSRANFAAIPETDGVAGGNNNEQTNTITDAVTDDQTVVDGDTRVILMDATLSLVVDDATAKVNEIRALASEM